MNTIEYMIDCFCGLFRSKEYDVILDKNVVLNQYNLTIEDQNRQSYILDYLAIKSDWKAIGFEYDKEYESDLRLELEKLRNK